MTLVSMGVWIALGVEVGFVLHWLTPSIDLGMGTLIGVVKRSVRAQGRAWVRDTTATEGEHLMPLSLFTATEIASALARRQREGGLPLDERDRLVGALLVDCARSYLLRRTAADVIQRALALVQRYPLRSAEAIQVAIAVELSLTLQEAQLGPVLVASADDRVLRAALQEGLPVDNPTLR